MWFCAATTLVLFAYTITLAPLGTVTPVPAEVFTTMLCPPVVLFSIMYGLSIVGTMRLRVVLRDTPEVTSRI
jgi:hypothetical protein